MRELDLLVRSGDLPLDLLRDLAGLLDRPADMMHVEQANRLIAAETSETVVTIYPSDRFAGLMGALRTRDFNLEGIENVGH